MKAYQLKIIRKKSKPPVWRRCIIPSGITFSQLVLILAQITEETPTEDYEFEFFQAGMHLREWGEDRPTVRKWNYDYLCASDSFIDTFLDAEGWFTFRTGSGGEFRAEIEKSQEIIRGLTADIQTAVSNMVQVKDRTQPNLEQKAVYDQGYAMYKKLFADLSDCFEQSL